MPQNRCAKQDLDRYSALVAAGAGTVQRAQQAIADFRERTAQFRRDQASLTAAEQQVAVLRADRAKAVSQLRHNEAVEHQAELNLGYTMIVSPIDGTVGSRTLRVGQYVQAGTQLMAVVPLSAVFVTANFKETQLTDVHRGEPATVEVDTFPGVRIAGHVDNLAPVSGLEFALLPPDNATGNFTKIVQRVSVKIAIDAGNRLRGLLRPGMSVEATIDTKAIALAQQPSRGAFADLGRMRRLAAR